MSSRGRSRRAPAVSSTQPFLGNALKGPLDESLGLARPRILARFLMPDFRAENSMFSESRSNPA